MRLVTFFFLLGMAAVLGCSLGTPEPPSAPDMNAWKKEMTTMLEEVAETGEAEETVGELRMLVDEELRDVDAAKADSLSKELDALEALSSPGEIKAKAKEIISKL